jgi:hypothetical protein
MPIDGENNQGIDFSVVMSQVDDRCFSLEVAVKLTLQNLSASVRTISILNYYIN